MLGKKHMPSVFLTPLEWNGLFGSRTTPNVQKSASHARWKAHLFEAVLLTEHGRHFFGHFGWSWRRKCFPCWVRSALFKSSASYRAWEALFWTFRVTAGQKKQFHSRGVTKTDVMCFLSSIRSTFQSQKCFPPWVRSTSFFKLQIFCNTPRAKMLFWFFGCKIGTFAAEVLQKSTWCASYRAWEAHRTVKNALHAG